MIKPNYSNLGCSTSMGPQLRAIVEMQLVDDLHFYSNELFRVQFDWSESCIEGRNCAYLDGILDNFSGIGLFDVNDNFIAEGWLEFIHEPDFFLVYWNHLDFAAPRLGNSKLQFGIPPHIWQKIPEFLRWRYEKERM